MNLYLFALLSRVLYNIVQLKEIYIFYLFIYLFNVIPAAGPQPAAPLWGRQPQPQADQGGGHSALQVPQQKQLC